MKSIITLNGKEFEVDFSQPIDISIPITSNGNNPIAWYVDQPEISAVKMGDWIGKVSKGSSTNFNNIFFNPHGHGTHTECLGHITHHFYSVNDCLKRFMFFATLVTVSPENEGDDLIITKEMLIEKLGNSATEALIIRTLPNPTTKKSINYSNTNPPYLTADAAEYLKQIDVSHLLIDLPSIDREVDGGNLLAHKAFWNVKNVVDLNQDARLNCTITEMIYVPCEIKDGHYLLNLQISSFENDASPSKPILYRLYQ